MNSPGQAPQPAEVARTQVPPPGPLRPFTFPKIQRLSLSNGLPVLFSRTEGLPIATFSLLMPGGGVREDPTQAGLSSLTASLIESGTAELDATGIAERLETLGARFSAGTSWEVAHVELTALVDRIEEGARLAASLVRDSVFPPSEVERIRQEQLAGILQRRAEPRGLASELISRFVFADDSPFSRPLSGTRQTVAGLQREDVIEFHRRTYTPNSAAVIAAGNLPADRVQSIAESVFGDWRGPAPGEPEIPVEQRHEGLQIILIERPGAVQSEIRLGHVGVSRQTADYFPIVVMNSILGGAFSSRLNLKLREKHGLTYGVSSSFVMRRQPGLFLISTAVQTDQTGRAVQEILSEVATVQAEKVSAAELADARQYLAGTLPLRLQTTQGVASRLAELFIYDLPDSYLEDYGEGVLGVTEDAVHQAATRYLHPDRATILVVGDAAVAPQLEALRLGPVRTLQLEDIP